MLHVSYNVRVHAHCICKLFMNLPSVSIQMKAMFELYFLVVLTSFFNINWNKMVKSIWKLKHFEIKVFKKRLHSNTCEVMLHVAILSQATQ